MTRPGAVVALAAALAGGAGCATGVGDADPLLARIDPATSGPARPRDRTLT